MPDAGKKPDARRARQLQRTLCSSHAGRYEIAQELGCEVCPIRPGECAKLRVKAHGSKRNRIPQRSEDRSFQGAAQIGFALNTIANGEPKAVTAADS